MIQGTRIQSTGNSTYGPGVAVIGSRVSVRDEVLRQDERLYEEVLDGWEFWKIGCPVVVEVVRESGLLNSSSKLFTHLMLTLSGTFAT